MARKKKPKRSSLLHQMVEAIKKSKLPHKRNHIDECVPFVDWVKEQHPEDSRHLQDARKHVDTYLKEQKYTMWTLEGLRVVFNDPQLGKGLNNSYEERTFLYACPYCGGKVELKESAYVYGVWKYSDYVYVCSNFPKCNASTTTHQGTKIPLGRLADKELKSYKIRVHRAFDVLWKDGKMKRTEAYKWLATQLKIPINQCHIGYFDIDTCKRVLEICNPNKSSLEQLDLPVSKLKEMLIEVGDILKNDISVAKEGFERNFMRNMYIEVVKKGQKPSQKQQYYIKEVYEKIKSRIRKSSNQAS